MKILIVDDDPKAIDMLEIILKSKGYDVMAAKNGQVALEMARINLPELVVSDMLMPVMDGYQLSQEWKKDSKLKGIPFIFITSTYIDKQDEELAFKMGADKFIRKPVEPDEFLKIIQSMIGDMEKGKIEPAKPVLEEKDTLKLYSERLVVKLEKNVLKLEKEIVERKQAEEALRESESRFHNLFDLSPQAIALTAVETGRFIDVNDKLCELTKYSKDELIGRTSTEMGLYSKENRDRFIKEFQASGEIHGLEMDFKTKDGLIINTLMFSKTIRISSEPLILTILLDKD
jgi:PAS domain S-box-containing protein